MQTPPFLQGLAQMAAGAGRAVWNAAPPAPKPRGALLPLGPGIASLTFITSERPWMLLFPALAAQGVGLPHLPPYLPPRHAVSGPGTQRPALDPGIWVLVGVLGVPLETPKIQVPHPSPVGATDAPSSAQCEIGLIHGLAVGLVVTERDHQRLLGADPLTALKRKKVGDIEWARPWKVPGPSTLRLRPSSR